nr:hypothetical protein CFP56_36154 [Quercus suber]
MLGGANSDVQLAACQRRHTLGVTGWGRDLLVLRTGRGRDRAHLRQAEDGGEETEEVGEENGDATARAGDLDQHRRVTWTNQPRGERWSRTGAGGSGGRAHGISRSFNDVPSRDRNRAYPELLRLAHPQHVIVVPLLRLSTVAGVVEPFLARRPQLQRLHDGDRQARARSAPECSRGCRRSRRLGGSERTSKSSEAIYVDGTGDALHGRTMQCHGGRESRYSGVYRPPEPGLRSPRTHTAHAVHIRLCTPLRQRSAGHRRPGCALCCPRPGATVPPAHDGHESRQLPGLAPRPALHSHLSVQHESDESDGGDDADAFAGSRMHRTLQCRTFFCLVQARGTLP